MKQQLPSASLTNSGEAMLPVPQAPETQITLQLSAADDPRSPPALAGLLDYMRRHHLTTSYEDRCLLANRMGTNETYIAKYLAKKDVGKKINFKLPDFEAKIDALLDAELVVTSGNRELVQEGFIVEPVYAFLRHVKAHGRIGVGFGDAGRGKTCAARLYAKEVDKTSVYIHVNMWDAQRHKLVKRIATAAGVKGPNYILDEVLVTRLTNSGRLIILDNAHRLTEPARKWIADFWEATRTPIALIGNPEIEKQFRANDQHGSRIGLHRDITLGLEASAEETAKHMIRLHFPEAQGDRHVMKEAQEVLGGFGSCRMLEMRATLAHLMIEGGKITDTREAFAIAATQLIDAEAA